MIIMDTKGLFDLSFIESAEDDDILNLSINESEQEFSNGSMGSPTTEFDKDAATGEKSSSIPGGNKEAPTAKPSNGETGPSIPGGDNEKPTAKPADGESGYSEPKSVTLTADTYNDAIDLLQKSFKEAYEITGMLRNATIVEKTAEDLQMEYIDDLILESFSEGPIFEAVAREDKKELKSIVKKIRKPVIKTLQGNGISAKKIGFLDKTNHVLGGFGGSSGLNKDIGGKMFQMLCTVKCSESDLKKILENINKTFEKDLGKYKILSVYAGGINADSSKMENSNVRNEYLLFVDTDIPSEFKRIDKLVKKESVDDCYDEEFFDLFSEGSHFDKKDFGPGQKLNKLFGGLNEEDAKIVISLLNHELDRDSRKEILSLLDSGQIDEAKNKILEAAGRAKNPATKKLINSYMKYSDHHVR